MSAQITEQTTRQVAQLARLDLSDSEVKTFTLQLKDILSYVDTLQSAEVEEVEPLTHPFDLKTPMREDRIVPPPRNPQGSPKVLDCAPDVLNDGYKVPPIL